ncbi:MAG: hypothetical protein IJX70_03295 [Clostridia bacterium]|nr:hypothetical protein [Clostridia bacterium]
MKEGIFTLQTKELWLSAHCCVFKTERLSKQTARMRHTDTLLDLLAMGLFGLVDKLPEGEVYLRLSPEDSRHVFWVCVRPTAEHTELIFCGYDSPDAALLRVDDRFVRYLEGKDTLRVRWRLDTPSYADRDFTALYRLTGTNGLYFPRLDPTQSALVIEDKNVLVQGVAGSGKTNMCIDKIIYTACRGYHGRTLYTTYSRGLLVDTQQKLHGWRQDVQLLIDAYREGRVRVLGSESMGVCQRLGLYLDAETHRDVVDRLESIVDYLDTKVDYRLIEDLYREIKGVRPQVADEGYFLRSYVGGLKNYHLAGRIEKVRSLGMEVIYKEIYGLIRGWCDPTSPQRLLSKSDYMALRGASFGSASCDTIYGIAIDYHRHLVDNGLTDNNQMSRTLLVEGNLPHYSLTVVDEVQDFTQVTLAMLAKMSSKMFCVGDALQMINPSYFRFAYLKQLLYDDANTRVAELKRNYRSGRRIEEIIEVARGLNAQWFGTHSFVLGSEAVGEEGNTAAVWVEDKRWTDALAKGETEDVTVVVADLHTKDRLQKALPKHEVLTVSEVKGLERDTVVLYRLLDTYLERWQTLERRYVNRKTADENSVYRYYFNLFYVGLSRARQHLFVVEKTPPKLFLPLLSTLERQSEEQALDTLARVAGVKLDPDEQVARIDQFLRLGQYDNARHAARRLEDSTYHLARIDVYEEQMRTADYHAAGLAFWQLGALADAKQSFIASGEKELAALMDAAEGAERLSPTMLRYLPELLDNPQAVHLLVGMVEEDLTRLTALHQQVQEGMLAYKKEKQDGTI